MDLYCFGDSITHGDSDTDGGGWVERLKTQRPDVRIFNLGVGGETSRMMRARLPAELERLHAGAPSLVLLGYGANDAAESEGSLLVPEAEYVANLSWAIDEIRRLGCQVWLVNVTPVAPAADGVRSPSGRLRSNAMVSRYNDALAELSRRKSVGLIDVNGAMSRHELASLFAPDGLHPNAAGHALICEVVRERLM